MSPSDHTRIEIEAAFRELGLTPAADLAEIRSQHRVLAYVWDPDRLPEHLRDAGAEKLERVYDALDVLTQHMRGKRSERPSAIDVENGNMHSDEDVVQVIAAALSRILTECGSDNFVTIYVGNSGDQYVQFAADKGTATLVGELVGRTYLEPEDRSEHSSIDRLATLGWAPREDLDGFYKEWRSSSKLERAPWARRIAKETVDVLRGVFGVVPSAAPRCLFSAGPSSGVYAEDTRGGSYGCIHQALKELITRTNADAFAIFTERGTGKFVQFAGGRDQPLILDLPKAELTETESDSALRLLRQYAEQVERKRVVHRPGVLMVGKHGLDLVLDKDVDKASRIAIEVFREVFQLQGDIDLEITEN